MADQHHGAAALGVVAAQERENILAAPGIKTSGGLVQDQHLRLHGHDAGDGHAALLAAGQGEGGLLQHVGAETYGLHRLADTAVDLPVVKPHVFGAEGHVLIDRLLEKLILRILEHQPHMEAHLTDLLGVGPDILPVQVDVAVRRLQKAVEVLDEGGFAAAGMADDAQKLAWQNVQRHILDGAALKGRSGAIGMCQMIDTNDGFQCWVPRFIYFAESRIPKAPLCKGSCQP